MRHIKIVKTKDNKVASLEIDGKPAKTDVLERLQFVGVELPSDELPTVTFKYRPSEVDIEIELEELTSLEETIFAEETEPQTKTFVGFELKKVQEAEHLIRGLMARGHYLSYILGRLLDEDFIASKDRHEAFMYLKNANDTDITRNIAENVRRYSESKGGFI